MRDESLTPEVLSELAVIRAYPDDPGIGDPSAQGAVEWIQTHLSHVFLTDERVYKFRKAVDLGFVCFTSRDNRDADCMREMVLNRRLAPDVYLGVAPLYLGPSGPRVGPASEALAADA